ncbi:ribosome maturation protein RimP [Pseudopontixanthobacter vadosimaris]|uniref:ribosome maturation protein RimP n=1 Tax=Pseudopontixanthobacter vadosimaris TaxID=2726450 RepID=UPI00147306B3|nr:ribosome maturation protein RimP [Pseudopontixanthobacter vadosimaris]
MADIDRLNEVIEPEARALGFDLVRVRMTSSEAGDGDRALQIMAEDPATGQLIIDQCAALSRRVSDRLDELEAGGETIIAGAYHLEVSSPGIDRPLTRKQDFANWAGHEVKVSLIEKVNGQRNIRGMLIGLAEDSDTPMAEIEDRTEKRIRVPLSTIHSAKLVLTDALIAATQPLDTSGADEIDEVTEEKADD